jgi:D-alanyl-lipoteichoic acid acyltransferase DltB (MBOAT superfamily)
MLTMLIGGLWHGASWLFVLWGGMHGLLLVGERLLRNRFGDMAMFQTRSASVLMGLVTWLLVCLTWVLFRAQNPADAVNLLGAMLTLQGGSQLLSGTEVLQVALVVGGLLTVHRLMRDRDFGQTARNVSLPIAALILAAMLIGILISPGEERAFIYFEF